MTRRLTTPEFIAKAQAVHGDRYDYSAAQYTKSIQKLTIICREHGPFEQIPNNHLRGAGCPTCGEAAVGAQNALTLERFIERSTALYGGKYDYSRVNYVTNSTPITIGCPIHGDFTQTPQGHLSGRGCRRCGSAVSRAKKLNTTESFIASARLIHGERYDYSRVQYVNAMQPVIITCPEHGEYQQKPNTHLNGSGCPECAIHGIWAKENGLLYVLDYEGMTKIGITCDIRQRLRRLRKAAGTTTIKPMAVFNAGNGREAFALEQLAHNHFAAHSAGLSGFDGASELFHITPSAAVEWLLGAGAVPVILSASTMP
ncbi:GIY-YIG nuclease family protein [Salmonella enterica]|nr:GIY-YIG nuclease family protein [Salmonella enterica]